MDWSKHFKAEEYQYPLLFVTVSGAHLYGFESHDSDLDFRGAHVTPAEQVLSMNQPKETLETMEMDGGVELDVVTHDIKKYFKLLLNRNGYVLEQVFSPLVAFAAPQFTELKEIAASCITRRHALYFRGFSEKRWRLFWERETKTVKKLLYAFRPLLCGIHLMLTGRVESNLATLNQEHRLSFIDELMEMKRSGIEKQLAPAGGLDRYQEPYQRLRGRLEDAMNSSTLPDVPSGKPALDDLLLRLRLDSLVSCQ